MGEALLSGYRVSGSDCVTQQQSQCAALCLPAPRASLPPSCQHRRICILSMSFTLPASPHMKPSAHPTSDNCLHSCPQLATDSANRALLDASLATAPMCEPLRLLILWSPLLFSAVQFAGMTLPEHRETAETRRRIQRRQLPMSVRSHIVPRFERECHFRPVRTSLVMDSQQGDRPPPDSSYCAAILSLVWHLYAGHTQQWHALTESTNNFRYGTALEVIIACRSFSADRRWQDIVAMQPAPGSRETGQSQANWVKENKCRLSRTRRLASSGINV